MFKLREWPIGRQILCVSLALCAAVFGILITIVSISVRQSATTVAHQNLKDELKIVANLMTYAYAQGVNRARRNVRQFVMGLPGPITVDDRTTRTGAAQLPTVRIGERLLNADAELLARFREQTGVESAVLLRHNGDLYRVATLLKDADGKPMHGSIIPKGDPLEVAYANGGDVGSMVQRNGKIYSSYVLPIKDAKGTMVAAVSARVDLTEEMAQFKSILAKVKIGKTGYLYAFRAATGDDAAVFSVHPTLEGKTLKETFAGDPETLEKFKGAIRSRGGEFHYQWPDAADGGKSKDKFAVFLDVPAWGWILGGGTFTEEFLAEANDLRIALIVESIVAALLLVGLLSLLLASRFARIKPMLAAMDRQGEGDLTARVADVPDASRNEIDMLARRFNQSAGAIGQLVTNLAAAANRIGGSSDELERSAGEIARSTEAQSQAANAMAASVEQLAVSIGQVTDHAREAAGSGKAAKQASGEGRATVQASIGEMKRIAEGIDESARLINQLGDRSRHISGIVNVIGEIASQTNLLALNAAIEAARAGDHGRGFAVVADEVRKLSERTSNSAQEITELIGGVQTETDAAVERMNAVAHEMSTGVAQAQQIGAALEHIDTRTGDATEYAAQIATAVREQKAASEDIGRRLEAVAQSAEENAALTSNNRDVAQRLRECADDLQSQIARFRVHA